jgi:hypothetical protein
MAAAEYAVVALIVRTGYSAGIVIGAGIGAAVGCLGAMVIHKRYVKKEQEQVETSSVRTREGNPRSVS